MRPANWLPDKQAVDPVLMNSMAKQPGMKHRQVPEPRKHGSPTARSAYRSIEPLAWARLHVRRVYLQRLIACPGGVTDMIEAAHQIAAR